MNERPGKPEAVTGWKLDATERESLLARFPANWPDIIADHVTLDSKADGNTPLPAEISGEIVGMADDGAGVQALVVRIGGTTDRPDGSTYHITWSLDQSRGRTAIESNDVIARFGWKAIGEPVPITLRPVLFYW